MKIISILLFICFMVSTGFAQTVPYYNDSCITYTFLEVDSNDNMVMKFYHFNTPLTPVEEDMFERMYYGTLVRKPKISVLFETYIE